MKLTKITIKNYKSIDKLEIDLSKNEKNTGLFGFLGFNESGKSNLLKAISMKDYLSEFNYDNFITNGKDGETIEVIYEFFTTFSTQTINSLLTENKTIELPKEFIDEIKIKSLTITSMIKKGEVPTNYVDFELKNEEIEGWEEDPINLVRKSTGLESNILNLNDFLEKHFADIILNESPEIIFWKDEPKYLMNEPINLRTFMGNPESSIPLRNCFLLAGVKEKNIPEKVTTILADALAQKNFIEDELDPKVTEFVNDVWPEHNVKIGFAIQGELITFTVKDEKGKHQELGDRSDGFKQFISFLLSSSAEVKNGELKDGLLLIDEPETHLHPTAQEYLRDEFSKISKKNIVMFATHSSYLIDKENFSDFFNVLKNKDLFTELKQFEDNKTTFSEINYVVFNIPTTDYHNELYGWCGEHNKLISLDKNKDYIQIKNDGTKLSKVKKSLSEYIRHQIHHPENKENTPFTPKELVESIKQLRGLKYDS